MVSKAWSMLRLLVRVLAIALIATDVALHATGIYPDRQIPLWFKAAWALAGIVALALAERKSGGSLAIGRLPPAIQAFIVAVIALAALPDPLRRGYMAVLVGALYWDGLAQACSSLRTALQPSRRQP